MIRYPPHPPDIDNVVQESHPNLIVSDVARSVAFYRDVLGFDLEMSVPDTPPYVFAGMKSGDVVIFLNDLHAAAEELPSMANRSIGGTLTLYIEVSRSMRCAIGFGSRPPS